METKKRNIRVNENYKKILYVNEKYGFGFKVVNVNGVYNKVKILRYGDETPYFIKYKNNYKFDKSLDEFKHCYFNSYKDRVMRRYLHIVKYIRLGYFIEAEHIINKNRKKSQKKNKKS